MYPSQFGRLEVWDQVASRVWWGPPSCFCVLVWQRGLREFHCVPFIRTLIPFKRAPPSWPSTFQRSHILTPSLWGLGFWHMNLGGHKHSGHSTCPWASCTHHHHHYIIPGTLAKRHLAQRTIHSWGLEERSLGWKLGLGSPFLGVEEWFKHCSFPRNLENKAHGCKTPF